MKTRREVGKEHIRKIQQTKGSYLMSIPIGIVRALGWKECQKVVVEQQRGGFLVRDWKPKKAGKK